MWFHKQRMPYKEGFVQATYVVLYIGLVSQVMSHGNEWFGQMDNKIFSPLAFLTLFIVSALVCSLLVFAKPYQLFVDKKGKEALNLVIATTKGLALYLILWFVILWLI